MRYIILYYPWPFCVSTSRWKPSAYHQPILKLIWQFYSYKEKMGGPFCVCQIHSLVQALYCMLCVRVCMSRWRWAGGGVSARFWVWNWCVFCLFFWLRYHRCRCLCIFAFILYMYTHSLIIKCVHGISAVSCEGKPCICISRLKRSIITNRMGTFRFSYLLFLYLVRNLNKMKTFFLFSYFLFQIS